MIYPCYIQRPDNHIFLDEWLRAAELVAGLRRHCGPSHVRDPLTNDLLPIHYSGGELEVLNQDHEWKLHLLYHPPQPWSVGRGVFDWKEEYGKAESCERISIAKLAQILKAEIVGSLSEKYDWHGAQT
jgi:hypothetical protein